MNEKDFPIPIKADAFKTEMSILGYYPLSRDDPAELLAFIKECGIVANPKDVRYWFNAKKTFDISKSDLERICLAFDLIEESLIDKQLLQKRLDDLNRKKKHDTLQVNNKEAFAKRLRAFVSDKGLSHAEFAERIYQKQETVEKWFQGKSMPQLWDLMEICDVFGIDLDYFMGRITKHSHDIQAICDNTGLTQKAVDKLIDFNDRIRHVYGFIDGLSLLLTDDTDILQKVLYCIMAYRIKDDIIIDINPEGQDFTAQERAHHDEYMSLIRNPDPDPQKQKALLVKAAKDEQAFYENYTDLETVRLYQNDNKGITALTSFPAKVLINNDFELDADLIRQTRINKLTSAIEQLADKVDKAGSFKDLIEE